MFLAVGSEVVGAADVEMADAVGEDPSGDGVPGGALGVGPGSVGFSALGEAFAQGVEQVVGEGCGSAVGGAGVYGQTPQGGCVCGMSGGRP